MTKYQLGYFLVTKVMPPKLEKILLMDAEDDSRSCLNLAQKALAVAYWAQPPGVIFRSFDSL